MENYLWQGWERWATTGAIVALPWWIFSSLPYWIARARRVDSAAGVRVIGVLAIFVEGLPALFILEIGSFWIIGPLFGIVLWVMALVWAISGRQRLRGPRYSVPAGPMMPQNWPVPGQPFFVVDDTRKD